MTTWCEARNFGVSAESHAAINSALADAAGTEGVNIDKFAEDVDRFLLSSARLDPADASKLRYADETVTAVLAYVATQHGVSLN